MAKVLPGAAVNQISGTESGTTWQNWKGMLIMREKPTPHNPQTARQTEVRAILAAVGQAWRDVLNQGQRSAWNQRAKNYPWFNVFGKSITMSGINLYLKQNFILLDHGLTRQDEPVPSVEPPDLADLILSPDDDKLEIVIPQLIAGTITAQTPFLDIWVAGGFTFAEIIPEDSIRYDAGIVSQALPEGRVHQKSDFKHVFYADDTPIPVPPPGDPSLLEVIIGEPPVARNVVVSITRYNKFGNFTPPRIFQRIIEKFI